MLAPPRRQLQQPRGQVLLTATSARYEHYVQTQVHWQAELQPTHNNNYAQRLRSGLAPISACPVGAIGTVLHRCADTAMCQDDVANVQLSARPVTPSIINIAFANGLAVEVSGGLEPLVRGTREPLLRRGCHVRKGSAANAQDGVGIPKVESRVQTQRPLPGSSWTALCAAMQNRNPGS